MSQTFPIVAIDGGAASGKSTTSRAIAEKLNFLHVDTGAHYRTLTHALLQQGANLDEPATIVSRLEDLELSTLIEEQLAKMAINGTAPEDAAIRSPEVNEVVAEFAAIPEVRQALFDYQRNQAKIAEDKGFAGLVMEGRDIGSVIFPDAPYRFFFHADPETRALRRKAQGQEDQIQKRDAIDSGRKQAPLTRPDGATEVDTAQFSLEEVIQIVLDAIAV
jgi:cytidylate kinase